MNDIAGNRTVSGSAAGCFIFLHLRLSGALEMLNLEAFAGR